MKGLHYRWQRPLYPPEFVMHLNMDTPPFTLLVYLRKPVVPQTENQQDFKSKIQSNYCS